MARPLDPGHGGSGLDSMWASCGVDRQYDRGETFLPDMSGKNVVITGCARSMGYDMALHLARKRAYVQCIDLDNERTADAARRLGTMVQGAVPGLGKVEMITADISDPAQVAAAAETIASRVDKVDLLINNAAVFNVFRDNFDTPEGRERQMATNHLGHFALTGRLLPLLRKSPEPKVVTVSSFVSWFGSFRGKDWKFDFGPQDGRRPRFCYRDSKLANLVFAQELGRRYPDIQSVAVHPGAFSSELTSPLAVIKMFYMYSHEAGWVVLDAATNPRWRSGSYAAPLLSFRGWPSPLPAIWPPQAKDRTIGQKLWDASVAATGVAY